MNNAFLRGIRHGIPIALGYLSVSFTFGMKAVGDGMTPLQALLMELQNNTEYLNRMAGMLGPDAIAEAAKMPSQALRMVLVVFIVVPIACAYPFFQRYIVSGLTVGSVKG